MPHKGSNIVPLNLEVPFNHHIQLLSSSMNLSTSFESHQCNFWQGRESFSLQKRNLEVVVGSPMKPSKHAVAVTVETPLDFQLLYFTISLYYFNYYFHCIIINIIITCIFNMLCYFPQKSTRFGKKEPGDFIRKRTVKISGPSNKAFI